MYPTQADAVPESFFPFTSWGGPLNLISPSWNPLEILEIQITFFSQLWGRETWDLSPPNGLKRSRKGKQAQRQAPESFRNPTVKYAKKQKKPATFKRGDDGEEGTSSHDSNRGLEQTWARKSRPGRRPLPGVGEGRACAVLRCGNRHRFRRRPGPAGAGSNRRGPPSSRNLTKGGGGGGSRARGSLRRPAGVGAGCSNLGFSLQPPKTPKPGAFTVASPAPGPATITLSVSQISG